MNGSLFSKVKSTIMTLAAVFFVLVGAYTWGVHLGWTRCPAGHGRKGAERKQQTASRHSGCEK
jgi:hypothetical protein|nr:MAG TPA: hypothetical protein [Caudoviricetes sp.]